MMKDYFFKREFRNDSNFVNEKIIADISMIDNLYDNNIKLNENLKSSTKSNYDEHPYENLGIGLKQNEIYQPTNNAGKPNLELINPANINPNLQYCNNHTSTTNSSNPILHKQDVMMDEGTCSVSGPTSAVACHLANLPNLSLGHGQNGQNGQNGQYSQYAQSGQYGLEEKATNTDDLTSAKIDQLIAINEQFMKCKEQFIMNCVKNQPDLIAKIFPDLFKKNKIYKPNLISIKRKREHVIIKSNQTGKMSQGYEKKSKDFLLNEKNRNEDSESNLSLVTSTKKGVSGTNPNPSLGLSSSINGGFTPNSNSNPNQNSKAEKIKDKLKEKKLDKRFGKVEDDERDRDREIERNEDRDKIRDKDKYRDSRDRDFENNYHRDRETEINSRLFPFFNQKSESSPQSISSDPKETNYLSTNLSEMCEVFNLPIPNKQKKTNVFILLFTL